MKKLIPAYILSFVIAFTVFIHEPIMLYASNKADLWFDFMTMLKPILLFFAIALIGLMLFYTIVGKLSKKEKVYNIILTISFIIFFASYIQGNYLLKDLPKLDGTTIIWKGFLSQNIITIIIWLLIITTYVLTIKKFSFEKVHSVSSKVALAVFIMLLASCLSTMLTTKKMFIKKYPILVTGENFANFSEDKNFIIFLIDAVDSTKFDNILKTSPYKDTFKDFTYYPDTISYYMFTRDSIPLILTGIPNHNEDDFYTYYNNAFDNSKFIDELINRDYGINLYEYELIWTTEKSKAVKNTKKISNKVRFVHFAKCNLKYVAFKYLPYSLKKYAHIERMNFNYSKQTENNSEAYSWDNIDNYKMIKNANVTKEKTKQFKFIHTNGAHVPYNQDEELNRISDKKGTYEKELKASIKLVDSYIKLLKDNNLYNNSVIVLMADHGFAGGEIIGRQNPILYIKGINEKHDNLKISDKEVSHIDLSNNFIELLNDKKSDQIFNDIPLNRKRKFIWYRYTKERYMIEYIQEGHAWETNKVKPTGKKYNR